MLTFHYFYIPIVNIQIREIRAAFVKFV
jgi:hypothetical protein